MKKLLILSLLVFTYSYVFAQLSDTKIMADIKKQEPKAKTIKLEGKNITEKVFENGAWVYYMRRNYRSVSSTKYPGVTYNYYGGIQYQKRGGAYTYDKLLAGDGYYEGFKNPDLTKLKAFIELRGLEFFGHYYNKIIGEMPEIKPVANSKWKWHSLKSASGKVKVTFTAPINYTELEKAEHVFTVRLYADGDKAVDRSTPWKSLGASEEKEEKKVISTTKHTADEVRAMPTLASIADEKRAEAELANLPKIDEIPSFNSSLEFFYYVHNIFMTKSPDEIKAYLYHLAASNCRAGKAINLMTASAQSWINKIANNEQVYKKTHCTYPSIKHRQNGMVEFFDKEEQRKIRFSAVQEDGKWKLTNVEYYPAKPDEVKRMEALPSSACDKNAPAKSKEYSISEAGFSIILPKTPEISKPGGNSNTFQMVCNHNGSEYLVTAEPLPASSVQALESAGTYQGTAINWGENLRKALGAAGSKPYNWEVNGTKGIQTEWRKSSEVIRYKSVILGDMYYRIMVSNAKKTEEENLFFNSFKSTKKNKGTQATTTATFKVGDKVKVKTTKGYMNAKILEVKGSKYKIKYSNPKYGAQWVDKSNVSK